MFKMMKTEAVPKKPVIFWEVYHQKSEVKLKVVEMEEEVKATKIME